MQLHFVLRGCGGFTQLLSWAGAPPAPHFSLTLVSAGLVLTPAVVQHFFPFLKSTLTEVQTALLTGSALAGSESLWSWLKVALNMEQLLDSSHRSHSCSPVLPKSYHVNPIQSCNELKMVLCTLFLLILHLLHSFWSVTALLLFRPSSCQIFGSVISATWAWQKLSIFFFLLIFSLLSEVNRIILGWGDR